MQPVSLAHAAEQQRLTLPAVEMLAAMDHGVFSYHSRALGLPDPDDYKWTAVGQTAALQCLLAHRCPHCLCLHIHSVRYRYRQPFSKYSPTEDTSGLFNTQPCGFCRLYLLLPPLPEMFLIFCLLILHKLSPSSQ